VQSIDPTTGEVIATYDETSEAEVERALAGAVEAQAGWREAGFGERAERLREAGRLLREEAGGLAELMAREMGKPLAQGRGEAEKCARVCEHYAAEAAGLLADEVVESDAGRSYVAFRPLGTVLAVMPWNFPLWQVFRFAAPALMAGNAGLLKHASNVSGCALAIEDLLRRAGLPAGLFRALLVGSDRVGAILGDERVAAVTLTGSTPAGKAVAERAGALVKKSVLELGGSDPYLVLADAELEATVETCVAARLVNSGQSCIAAKRFVVVEEVLEPFLERFVAAMEAKIMGDPRGEVDLGPQARRDLRDDLHRQVEESVGAGARLLLGGAIPDGPGAFYPPTVLADVVPGMPAWDEELFGPVAAVIAARDERHAVAIANGTSFGLGAAVFSADVERAERIARDELEAGACFVNAFVRSDPRLPFGGIKESGYGRELGAFGIREFVNVKTVWVA
jgi:succinate-semialdehyde dehydrogenase/glutarate-semialdehyde dehydrogenase